MSTNVCVCATHTQTDAAYTPPPSLNQPWLICRLICICALLAQHRHPNTIPAEKLLNIHKLAATLFGVYTSSHWHDNQRACAHHPCCAQVSGQTTQSHLSTGLEMCGRGGVTKHTTHTDLHKKQYCLLPLAGQLSFCLPGCTSANNHTPSTGPQCCLLHLAVSLAA